MESVDSTRAPAPEVRPLTGLLPRQKGKIVSVEGPESVQLSGYGIYPGSVVEVRQRFPSIVIKSDETELAVERDVAGRILVELQDQ